MTLQQALEWADKNSGAEATDRLRSRAVVKTLASTVRTYERWIEQHGEYSNTCTRLILGRVCPYCQCEREDK